MARSSTGLASLHRPCPWEPALLSGRSFPSPFVPGCKPAAQQHVPWAPRSLPAPQPSPSPSSPWDRSPRGASPAATAARPDMLSSAGNARVIGVTIKCSWALATCFAVLEEFQQPAPCRWQMA